MALGDRSSLDPPDYLSDRAKSLWLAVVPHRAKSAARLALLTEALVSLDRADEARHLLSKQGLVTSTPRTGALHLNPLAKLEREARQTFARIMVSLRLTWDARTDGESS